MLTRAEILRLRSLRIKKNRNELGLFVVEGEKVVGELIAANFPFVEIYATADWRSLSPSAARVQPISDQEMARISHFPTPSAVLAVGRIRREPLPPGALDHGLTLALDAVQDAGNVGTLLRIADWFAIQRVVCSPDCADIFNQKVINASMGSFSRVPVHYADLPTALRGSKVPVLGCDLRGDDVHALEPLHDAVIVIGNEGQGLSPKVKECITRHVTIARHGRAESLNAAIAAAIVCDNLRRPHVPVPAPDPFA